MNDFQMYEEGRKEDEKDVSSLYLRPKTRGELLEALKKNIKCEVVATNEEITSVFLDGWLNFMDKYKTYASGNIGWVVYEAV